MKSKFISILLAGCLAVCCIGSVGAEDLTVDSNTNEVTNGTATTPVKLTTDTLTFSVTVPTSLPVHVDTEGAVSIADNAAIVNNSAGPVKVENVKVEADENWTLAEYGDLSGEKVGTKKFGFAINNVGASATDGSCAAEFAVVPARKSESFTYSSYISPQATEIADTIANVVFTIGWDEAVEDASTNWLYVVDTATNTITLNKYIGANPDVVVQSKYLVNGVLYENVRLGEATYELNSDSVYDIENFSGIFAHNPSYLTDLSQVSSIVTSISFEDGVKAPVNAIGLFAFNTSLKSIDLTGLDTSETQMMTGMFGYCTELEALDVSTLDTSNVFDMTLMFGECGKLQSIDLTGFNTTNVVSMENMFWNDVTLELVNLSSFDTSNTKNLREMFNHCSSLKTIYASDKFVTINTTNTYYMFYNCFSLVGGNGTTYDSTHTDKTYACIDTPENPGYFTAKT